MPPFYEHLTLDKWLDEGLGIEPAPSALSVGFPQFIKSKVEHLPSSQYTVYLRDDS
jgi:hypothetical protein